MGFGLEDLGDVCKWPLDTCEGEYQPWGRWPVLGKENTGYALGASFAFCACLSFWSAALNQRAASVGVLRHGFVVVSVH